MEKVLIKSIKATAITFLVMLALCAGVVLIQFLVPFIEKYGSVLVSIITTLVFIGFIWVSCYNQLKD